MKAVKIEWVGSPNFRKGRNGRKPIAIVNHITAGLFPGCLNWMQNPVAKASAHYLVTKTGRILQLVKDEDTAWHAGQVNKPSWPLYDGTNPNQYTIGIEHEALGGQGLTEDQFRATAWLHRQLVDKWNIPIDTDHIIGHYRIDSVNRPNCPGNKFNWGSLFKVLKGGNKSIKNIVICLNDIDKRAGLYLGDFLQCEVKLIDEVNDAQISSTVENVYVIGSPKKYNTNTINIVGAGRYETARQTLELCRR